MLDIKIQNCNTNMDQDRGYYIDMSMEIFPGTIISNNKLSKVQEYVINGQYQKLFTYLADNVK